MEEKHSLAINNKSIPTPPNHNLKSNHPKINSSIKAYIPNFPNIKKAFNFYPIVEPEFNPYGFGHKPD